VKQRVAQDVVPVYDSPRKLPPLGVGLRYREVGNTGMRISEIGFGTGDNAGLMLKGTFEQQVEAVERSLELGINYFDTSPDYGKSGL
jgi:predicted aldo/keto reductase-like oxidoreductase